MGYLCYSRVMTYLTKALATAAAGLILASGSGNGGCSDSKGSCHPGDTRAAHGHTDRCNDHGKWEPMTKQTKP